MTSSPAADRNKAPILEVLTRVLPGRAVVLEVASGTGQHAAHFAASRSDWDWQPTDGDPDALASIAALTSRRANVRPPLALDVCTLPWPLAPGRFDAVFCANLLHISEWRTCAALMAGAARCLAPGGVLFLYGPYLVDGEATAPGNVAFDLNLRQRNPAWGLRALHAVVAEAGLAGLGIEQRVAMPANNLMLLLRKVISPDTPA